MQAMREGLYYAVVDEADSILIDESRNPMIISQQVRRVRQRQRQRLCSLHRNTSLWSRKHQPVQAALPASDFTGRVDSPLSHRLSSSSQRLCFNVAWSRRARKTRAWW